MSAKKRPAVPELDRRQSERIAKALADPTRAAILERIASRDEAASAVLREEAGSAATMTHHLRELEGAGLIDTRKAGQFLYACVRRGVIASYLRHLCERFG